MRRSAVIPAAFLMLAGPASAGTGDAARSIPDQPLKALLRGVEPGTTGSVEAAPATPARYPCPPERRVGTGAGFCLIN